jgi:hypothetical protein
MEIIVSKYKKVADFYYELFRIAKLPLYFGKYSNKIYSSFQKLFLLVYKQFCKFTYEELMNDLEDNITLKVYLGFKIFPDYTTLIKFSNKLPASVIDKLFTTFKELIPEPKKAAIDSTGISLNNASQHYRKRIGIPTSKRPFMKTSFIVDIENHIILLCKMRKKQGMIRLMPNR